MVGKGNIITLGGVKNNASNGFLGDNPPGKPQQPTFSWRYLQTRWKSRLRILAGFTAASLIFLLTHELWLLMFFGGFIWLSLTVMRTAIEALVAGGAIRRSLLRWNDFVDRDRLSETLMLTGFSAILLDYLTKTVIMEQGLFITADSAPVILYATLASVNGIYVTGHNLYRGFATETALANLFKIVLSIPIAVALNSLLGFWLLFAGMADGGFILQGWAAVISKFSSDLTAGFVEGASERSRNVINRVNDYRHRFAQFSDVCAKLEMRFPENDIHDLLDQPTKWFDSPDPESRYLVRIMIINALDLMYFWMYQPRARTALDSLLDDMEPNERGLLLRAQGILEMEREISQLFVDGILGRNFSSPLAFYLEHYKAYLDAMHRLNISPDLPRVKEEIA